ncbi:MAG TPA: hypothetical protein VHV55_08810 [Pirellulales bacterium]|nr:hypothetical protein [Pirellulales bacterium]
MRSHPVRLSVLLLLAASCGWMPAVPVLAETPPAKVRPASEEPKPGFVRLLRDGKDRPIALQTAIVRYTRSGREDQKHYVDLVGAVHIADTAYYRGLNERFEKYDALLYELVAPPGTVVPKTGAKSSHPIGQLQQGLTGILDLDFQLDRIDYHKPNFVHADMSPDEFKKSMEQRNESLLTMFFRMMGYSISQQGKHPEQSLDAALLSVLFDPDPSLALKRIMAQQFEDLEGSIGAIEGPDGSTIISERNKVALAVLAKQLAAGKQRLGIFYGAGHLPDMEKRLEKDFGLKRQSTTWITAWDMTGRSRRGAGK